MNTGRSSNKAQQRLIASDGELEDVFFCPHCGALNPPAPSRCVACEAAIFEPSEVRLILQRLSQSGSPKKKTDSDARERESGNVIKILNRGTAKLLLVACLMTIIIGLISAIALAMNIRFGLH